ncbi:hypothetical protein HK104_006284 [Borealophlyctis nickersoniae]|nr:hypothetical protein HK104_006284 [Borealophlyctis nickersoniae]
MSTGLSCYVVYLARRFDVPWWVTVKMVWNVMLNAGFGAIPGVGSVFDVAYKPNLRNLHLLEEHLRRDAVERLGSDARQVDEAIRSARIEVLQEADMNEDEGKGKEAEKGEGVYPSLEDVEGPPPPLPHRD